MDFTLQSMGALINMSAGPHYNTCIHTYTHTTNQVQSLLNILTNYQVEDKLLECGDASGQADSLPQGMPIASYILYSNHKEQLFWLNTANFLWQYVGVCFALDLLWNLK